MAVRPLIRPRPRVIAPQGLSAEELQQLPRVLSRVCECAGLTEHQGESHAPRQPVAIRPTTVSAVASVAKQPASASSTEAKPAAVKPTLPAFWQSRKVIIAASVAALVTAIGIGYQFRPKQQIIVVHPAKQPAAVATSPASNNTPKPAFQPLSPAAPAASSGKETTSTASLMPRATWPAEKTPTATPTKNPAPQIQTATKSIDTRTSLNSQPAGTPMQENLPRMSPQFPQTPTATSNTPSNASVVYNPTMNVPASPLASGYANQNNLPPQGGMSPQYTASLPNYQPSVQPSQPQASADGSFGAYGGARFEGQIQPLPLRR